MKIKLKYIWFIAAILIISIGLLNPFIFSDNIIESGIDYYLKLLFYHGKMFIVILILAVIVGLTVFVFKKQWGLQKILATALIISALTYSIKPLKYLIINRKRVNHCTKLDSGNRLILETDKAYIYFKKHSLIDKIEKNLVHYYKDTSLYYNYRSDLNLKELLKKTDLGNHIFKDTFYFLPDTFRVTEVWREGWINDTVPIIDGNDLRNQYLSSLSYLILDILEEDSIMVYNKSNKAFEEYIYAKKWYDDLGSSGIDFYFSNDSIFISEVLTWGL